MTTESVHATPTDATPTDAATPMPVETSLDRIRLGPVLGAVVTLMAAVVVAGATQRLGEVIGVVFAAAVLALLSLPIRRRLQGVMGGAGTAITALVSLVSALVVGWLALRDLDTQMNKFADRLRERIADVDTASTTGRVIRSLRVDVAIDKWLDRVPELIVIGGDGNAEMGRRIFILVTIVVLAAFMQASGDQMVNWVASRWPREAPVSDDQTDPDAPEAVSPRLVVRSLLADVDRRGVGAIRRTLVLSTLASTVIVTAGLLLGVDGAVVIGVFAGMWLVLPTLGWIVALLPPVVLALVHPDPTSWTLVGIIVLTAVATTAARRRFVDRKTMAIGLAPYVIGIALGVSVGGLPGSLITLTMVATTMALLTSDHHPGRPTGWMVERGRSIRFGGLVVPTGFRGAALILGATAVGVVLWNVLAGIAPAIAWLVIATFVAIAIRRPVGLVERRLHLSHRSAVALVVGIIGSILVVVSTTGAGGLSATASITEDLPHVVEQLETSPIIGGWLRDHDAAIWMQNQLEDLPQRVSRLSPASILPSVGTRVLDLFWTGLLALALLFDGGRIVRGATRLTPARYRRQVTRLTGVTAAALGGYAAGAALLASINASVVFTLAIVLGVGLAPALAVWAFIWNFVPQIGGFMGGLPLIIFALVAGPLQALVAGLVFLTYQLIENHLLQPAIISAAIDVPPWGTLVAALAGGAAAGVIGAVVVTPLVGVVRVVRAELARDDFPAVPPSADPQPEISTPPLPPTTATAAPT
ncbi:MAG: AI-2E family transporter [Ilumatobacteraceae bacterium]